MATRTTFVFVIGAVLAASSPAAAQRWGRGPFPGSGACFFKDTNFRGEYFCVPAGEDVRRVPDDMNDGISSIRVFGRAEVTVFRDDRFNGGSSRFGDDVRDLRDRGWNDRISSLRVQIASRDGRDSRDGRPGDRQDDRGGRPGDDRRGDDRRDRPRGEEVDRIVRRAYQDVLGRDPDEGGLRQYRSRIIDDGWSEAQIRDSLRNSPEYREKVTMTRPKAQEIVRRAYLAVLKREPDAGAEGYINNVLRANWSQEDVERELRNSSEFRNKNR